MGRPQTIKYLKIFFKGLAYPLKWDEQGGADSGSKKEKFL